MSDARKERGDAVLRAHYAQERRLLEERYPLPDSPAFAVRRTPDARSDARTRRRGAWDGWLPAVGLSAAILLGMAALPRTPLISSVDSLCRRYSVEESIERGLENAIQWMRAGLSQ